MAMFLSGKSFTASYDEFFLFICVIAGDRRLGLNSIMPPATAFRQFNSGSEMFNHVSLDYVLILWGTDMTARLTDRVLNYNWTATPKTNPNMTIVRATSNAMNVYASWNGATEVGHWELVGAADEDGSDAHSLYNKTRSQFETSMTVQANSDYTYFKVRAIDKDGKVLGQSDYTYNSAISGLARANHLALLLSIVSFIILCVL
jgi:hypothetical protein